MRNILCAKGMHYTLRLCALNITSLNRKRQKAYTWKERNALHLRFYCQETIVLKLNMTCT